MGLRLSFGIGPLRASIPLTSGRRRRRKKSRSYHGSLSLPDGSSWDCHHQHRTAEAANECARKHARQVGMRIQQPSMPPPVGRRHQEYDLNRPLKDVWMHGTVGELIVRRRAGKQGVDHQAASGAASSIAKAGPRVPGLNGEPPQWWPRSGWGTVRDYAVSHDEYGRSKLAFKFVPDDGGEVVPIELMDTSLVVELGEYARGIMRDGNITLKVSAESMRRAEDTFQRINQMERAKRELMFADRSDIDGDCGWAWTSDYMLVKVAPGVVN